MYIAIKVVLFYMFEAPTLLSKSGSQVHLQLYIAFYIVLSIRWGRQNAVYSNNNCMFYVLEVQQLVYKSRSQGRLQLYIAFQVAFQMLEAPK